MWRCKSDVYKLFASCIWNIINIIMNVGLPSNKETWLCIKHLASVHTVGRSSLYPLYYIE